MLVKGATDGKYDGYHEVQEALIKWQNIIDNG